MTDETHCAPVGLRRGALLNAAAAWPPVDARSLTVQVRAYYPCNAGTEGTLVPWLPSNCRRRIMDHPEVRAIGAPAQRLCVGARTRQQTFRAMDHATGSQYGAYCRATSLETDPVFAAGRKSQRKRASYAHLARWK